MSVSEPARTLHSLMLSTHNSSYLYTQAELQDLVSEKDLNDLLRVIQELTNTHLIKLSYAENGSVLFNAVTLSEAALIKSLSPDEVLIYNHISEAGRNGIWTKTLHAKTNLHHNVITRCLKSLEAMRHVKQVKSVKHPTRKIFMLAEIEPALELSGGPWFTDGEIDTEFIESISTVIWKFVGSKSYPPRNEDGVIDKTYATNYQGFPTVMEIYEFVKESGVANVELNAPDIRTLCEKLVYDKKLERVHESYKVTWESINESKVLAADLIDFEW